MVHEYKCVLSLRVARHLLSQGFEIVDLERSKKFSGVVFKFKNTEKLNEAVRKFTAKGA
ncbi:DUF5659 domain-containing protein [Alkalihalobacillus sp. LMS6]|uniref:DUF5659 domain-containing protein n=1 Tax=Alkalihalobacillus sp. LMS6 TaxID=2924034 RepID=UPI0034E967C3